MKPNSQRITQFQPQLSTRTNRLEIQKKRPFTLALTMLLTACCLMLCLISNTLHAATDSMSVAIPGLAATTPAPLATPTAVQLPQEASPTADAEQRTLPHFVPTPPTLSAKSYLLLDPQSGSVLVDHNADLRLPPASLTKMMTLYIIATELKAGKLHLDDTVKISKKAWQTGGSRMFVKVGSDVPVNLLIKGIAIDSGNDACVAMAEHIAGNETSFAAIMNQTAAQLGMNASHFVDSTGLPHADHYTTARDLSKLAQAFIRDFPEYYTWFSDKWFTYNKIKQPNRNRLLWRDNSVDGFKTGHTDEAGFCLVASAKRDDMRLISVIMGTNSDSERSDQSQTLLNYGFHFFETHRLYSAHTQIQSPRIWLGSEKNIPLGVSHDLFVTIPSGEQGRIKAQISGLDTHLEAPITEGTQYGTLQILLGDKPIATTPLVALKSVSKGSLISRLSDHVSYFGLTWWRKFFHKAKSKPTPKIAT